MSTPPKPPTRIVYATMGLLLAALLIGAAAVLWSGGGGTNALSIGGPFTLEDGNAKPVKDRDFRGRYMLVYFGYTFCPDVCPTTLAQLRELQGKLPQEVRDDLQVVFVSVDPNRDTPQQIKQYLGYFNAGFQGLTGTPENIQKLANAMSIPYIPADTSKPNYTVDHSGNLVIIGPDGEQHGFIRAPLNNAKLEAQLPGVLKPQA